MKFFILKISVAVAAFLLGAFLTFAYKSGNTFLSLKSVKTAFTVNNSQLRVEKKTPKEKIRMEFQGYRATKTHVLVSYWLINDTKESIYYFAVADEPCAMMKLNGTEYGLYDLPTFACSLRPREQRLKAGQSILFEIPIFESSSSIKLNLDILIGRKGEKHTIESDEVYFR